MGMRTLLGGSLLAACMLAGCGGGTPTSVSLSGSDAMPGGIYLGTVHSNLTNTNLQAVGIVTEAGHAKVAAADSTGNNGAIYALSTITPNGQDFSATFDAYAQGNTVFANGGTTGSGTVSGTIISRSSINATYSGPGNDSGTASLTYQQSLYEQPASLSIIAGTYSFGYTDQSGASQTASITIDSGGAISGSDTAGCTFAGQLQVPDASYNAYDGSVTQTCSQTSVTFDTVGFFTPATSSTPAELSLIGSSAAASLAFAVNAQR